MRHLKHKLKYLLCITCYTAVIVYLSSSFGVIFLFHKSFKCVHDGTAHTKLLSESKCHLAPTSCSQGSQPLTWEQARYSCWAECPLCPFSEITHAASLLWTFRTLLPSRLSSAPAPLAVEVCRSTRQHTWEGKQRVCLCNYHTFCNIYQHNEIGVFLFTFMFCTCDPTLSYD